MANDAMQPMEAEMLTAVLWCLGAGLIITGLGILYGKVNKHGQDPMLFNWYGALFLAVICAGTVRWGALLKADLEFASFAPLLASMSASGAFMVAGVIAMIAAMRLGRMDIAWSVTQTSMVIPFVMGVLVFGCPVNAYNILGLLGIILGIGLFGIHGNAHAEPGGSRKWLLVALISFLLVGSSQFCFSIPSYWHGWKDEFSLRIPIQAAAGLLCIAVWKPSLILKLDFKLCAYGALFALLTYAGRYALYGAIDALSALNMAAIAYPACQGISILGIVGYQAASRRSLNMKTVFIACLMVAGLLLIGLR